MKRLLVFIVVLALAAGCRVFPTVTPTQPGEPVPATQPPAEPPTESPTESPTAAATTAPVEVTPPAPADTQPAPPTGEITLELLQNFTYVLYHTPDGRIPLQNGIYDLVTENPPVRVHSELVQPPAFGDLNGDGLSDAAVFLRTNTGGTGTFYDLIVLLNNGGTPLQAGFAHLGDRQVINDLRIENRRIVVDYITQGPQDGACCPSQHALRTYRVEAGSPRLTSEQLLPGPEAATPVPDQIVIDQPAWGAQALPVIQVYGRINPVPAQGYVEYYLTDYFNTLLASGQMPVTGNPGGEGQFAGQVPFESGTETIGILKLEIVHAEGGMLYGRSVVELFTP